jgi:hypothetical protein
MPIAAIALSKLVAVSASSKVASATSISAHAAHASAGIKTYLIYQYLLNLICILLSQPPLCQSQ